MARELQQDQAMERYWTEVVFTYVALSAHPLTRHLADPYAALIDRVERVSAAQREQWKAEFLVDARIAFASDAIDTLTDGLLTDKLYQLRKHNPALSDRALRSHSELKLYVGSMRPSDIVKLALGAQLDVVDDGPQKLNAETAPEIQAFAERFTTAALEGRALLDARSQAAAATALHRVKDIESLVVDINRQRRTTAATLEMLALEHGQSKAWQNVFFRQPPAPDRGEARGKAQAILIVLNARGIAVTEDTRQKILATLDGARLDAWIARSASVASADELVAT